jgi:hypothetical protein
MDLSLKKRNKHAIQFTYNVTLCRVCHIVVAMDMEQSVVLLVTHM